MGVYIKGMEMPTEGEYNMTLYVCSDGSAYMDVASFPVDKDRFKAVPVPTHGRLIDEEALAQDAYRRMLECAKYERPDERPYELLRAIELAPTVIPAEDGKI